MVESARTDGDGDSPAYDDQPITHLTPTPPQNSEWMPDRKELTSIFREVLQEELFGHRNSSSARISPNPPIHDDPCIRDDTIQQAIWPVHQPDHQYVLESNRHVSSNADLWMIMKLLGE